MMMLARPLDEEYVVRDEETEIRFEKSGRGTL